MLSETGGGYLYRSELVGVLKGLGFTEDEFSKPVATLSGGQKTRVALGRLLLQNPDLIILDEPTNHLDMNSIAWLETYLLNYKGAVLIVSHDRYFLDLDRRESHRDRQVQGYNLYGQLLRLCRKKGTAARCCLECLYEPAA